MDEEIEKQEGKETTTENTDDRLQSETISELDRADQIAERQKRENDRREKLLIREESLEARRKIGGVAEGGKSSVAPKEETAKEYKDKVMSGMVE